MLVSLVLTAPFVLLASPARAATAAVPYDVDGDGFADLAIGRPVTADGGAAIGVQPAHAG